MHWLQAVVTQRPKTSAVYICLFVSVLHCSVLCLFFLKLAGEKESQAGTIEKQLSYYEYYRNKKFIYNFSIHSELIELATKRLNVLFNKCWMIP